LKNGSKYSKVLLTDVPDVVFQRDPFDYDFKNGRLYCFRETKTIVIGASYWTQIWVCAGFGRQVLDKIRDKVVVCSGVVIGSIPLVLDYLEKMVEAFRGAKSLLMGGRSRHA